MSHNKNVMKQNDTFVLLKPVEAIVIGEHRAVILPAKTIVTVVLTFGDPNSTEAYEVEAFLPKENIYVLASVKAHDAVSCSCATNTPEEG